MTIREARLLSLFALATACGSAPVPPPDTPASSAEAAFAPPPEAPVMDSATHSSVAIAEDIRRACGISDSEAFFDYDSSHVREKDKAVLKKLADCFTTGPLKGREMRLVGHADPRGDEGYNYVLGQRRADNVKSAIVGVGMTTNHVVTSSRGEHEATGGDETGWAKDRRVEVLLGS